VNDIAFTVYGTLNPSTSPVGVSGSPKAELTGLGSDGALTANCISKVVFQFSIVDKGNSGEIRGDRLFSAANPSTQ
jgi:hypothetical protein